jgi:hypothetical protein
MTVRILMLTTAILALAASAATAANVQPVAVEAIMTLRSLGSEDWQLDIQNSSLAPVTIKQITWEAPAGVKVDRIVGSHGGTCRLSDSGFQCKTHLAVAASPSSGGDDLTVHFKGPGPKPSWVATGSGGYWSWQALQPGRAVLITSPARAATSAP